jgi:hypothetical protein
MKYYEHCNLGYQGSGKDQAELISKMIIIERVGFEGDCSLQNLFMEINRYDRGS